MEKLFVLLFYNFVNIENPEEFKERHLELCKKINLKGRILIAKEGLNGSISGTKEQVKEYKKELNSDYRFKEMVFKEDEVLSHPFKKIQVKVRKEIVTFGETIDMSKTGDYILPEGLYDLYSKEKPGEDFIILDTRNDYEYNVGRFKNSVHLNIENFRDFPKALDKIESFKDKKIITYCTGGIRCEKASAYMKEKGFKNVYQLKDGILIFGKRFPDTFWEGKCFVFDKRMVSQINSSDSEENTITTCESCNDSCDLYKNCRNVDCNRLVILCLNCRENLSGCCSEECKEKYKKEILEKFNLRSGKKISTESV